MIFLFVFLNLLRFKKMDSYNNLQRQINHLKQENSILLFHLPKTYLIYFGYIIIRKMKA